MAEENRRGFHNPVSQGHDHNSGAQGQMAPPVGSDKGMKEPTNHAGHTHEMARRHEHDARVEAMRSAHAGHGQQDHERILHDTHKLHQTHAQYPGNKYGASSHVRNGGAERDGE